MKIMTDIYSLTTLPRTWARPTSPRSRIHTDGHSSTPPSTSPWPACRTTRPERRSSRWSRCGRSRSEPASPCASRTRSSLSSGWSRRSGPSSPLGGRCPLCCAASWSSGPGHGERWEIRRLAKTACWLGYGEALKIFEDILLQCHS